LFDEEKGYHTCGLLGRIAETDRDMSDEEYDSEIERAIDEIIKNDFTGLYRKVKSDSSKKYPLINQEVSKK
jgi:hypothetical protein